MVSKTPSPSQLRRTLKPSKFAICHSPVTSTRTDTARGRPRENKAGSVAPPARKVMPSGTDSMGTRSIGTERPGTGPGTSDVLRRGAPGSQPIFIGGQQCSLTNALTQQCQMCVP